MPNQSQNLLEQRHLLHQRLLYNHDKEQNDSHEMAQGMAWCPLICHNAWRKRLRTKMWQE